MREFARQFYKSKQWKAMREYIFGRDLGLCVKCGKPGEIVHHKIHLTPENIDDPFIALNEDNLELVCRECHADEHNEYISHDKNLMFDENGDLISKQG